MTITDLDWLRLNINGPEFDELRADISNCHPCATISWPLLCRTHEHQRDCMQMDADSWAHDFDVPDAPKVEKPTLTVAEEQRLVDQAWIAIYRCGCVGAVGSARHMTLKRFVDEVLEGDNDVSKIDLVSVNYAKDVLVSDCPHTPKWGSVS